ncbi:MAG TPA: thiamine phosphate synthase [Candidatus Acidoferrales bacterium]|jgi:thiamine-phosphate pyrophosphorylase|nr:thiamine phosphate synthase [Candidatus Acidoferrales bacterium]
MKPLEDCRLYTFVDTAYLNGRAPEMVVQQLCDGGGDLIQLRAKGISQIEIRRIAELIVPITKRAGVGLVINDYPEIARAVGAEFCHLGQEDCGALKRKKAKGKISNSQIKLGLSTHSPQEAGEAIREGADYIAVGPVYATGTKPGRRPVTLEYVRWAAQHVKVPWFAIGGINLENLDEVLAAGAKRICVVSAILNAPDVAGACREFQERISAIH